MSFQSGGYEQPLIDDAWGFFDTLLSPLYSQYPWEPSYVGYVPWYARVENQPQQPAAQTVIQPPVSVATDDSGGGIESQTTYVYQVLPGPEPVQQPYVLVTPPGSNTEVERYEEGDFPAGSIFAPGRQWGAEPESHFDDPPGREDMAIDWGGVLDWGLDTIAGKQPWQIPFAGPSQPGIMNLGPVATIPAPSGIPGQPGTVYGYSGGQAVTSTGDQCGNRRYVTLDRETGKISCKRRRRRRLLTNRDLADLASLKTITGGGAALNAAVIRAVR